MVMGQGALRQGELLHLGPDLLLALLDDGLHHQPGALHDGQGRVLEQTEQRPAPSRHLLQERVELLALRGLAVGRAQGEGEEVEHAGHHQGALLPDHVGRPHVEQPVQELVTAQEGRLVELLLAEVVVLVHRLHQGAQHVYRRVRDAVVIPLECLGHLPADLLPEAEERGEAAVAGLAGHKPPQGVELLLQLQGGDVVLVSLLSDQGADGAADQLLLVLGEQVLGRHGVQQAGVRHVCIEPGNKTLDRRQPGTGQCSQ